MANFPCQDCKKYMCKYEVKCGNYSVTRMKRTCAAEGIDCVHQTSATPCKRSNCSYWDHKNSVNGISWCEKCEPYMGDNGETELTCKACMLPETFDLWDADEIAFIEGEEG